MLTVYTRHSQKCPHKDDIAWRRCRCPKWIQGTPSEDHEFLRTSAATRTWEQAEEKARKLEEEARPGAHKTAPAITIAEAVAAYRADETARCLSKSTTNQSKTLFQFHLLAWAKDIGLTLLRELTTPNLVKFRATWGNGPNTTRRKHERLIGFFEFCIGNDWLDKNQALKMKKAEEKRVPTDYFIHHDLCWNPSTLEQRTGRVDRIGSKAERSGQPIRVYLPYLAETQDEKQYRVVMDRERWFSVVMGEKFKVDARNTEKLASRIPLPESVAQQLAFRLAADKVEGLASRVVATL